MADPCITTRSPAPVKPRVKVDAVGDELVLRWRSGNTCALLFLMVWMTMWTAGCVMMLHKLLTNFEWEIALFATPFFAAWVAVACVIIGLLFGRERLVISRHDLRHTWQALITLSDRTVPLEEVALASADRITSTDSDGDTTVEGVINIETIGQPVQFAKGIADDEAAWLAETINTCFDRLAPNRAALTDIEAVHDAAGGKSEIEAPIANGEETANTADEALVFQPSRNRREQPSDSRWRLTRGGRAVQFTHRGRTSLADMAGLTFVNLFWNGIVGVFVYQLFKDFQWFLALFLVPFEIIGLVMIISWLYAISSPLWGVCYTIRFGSIERTIWGPVYRSRRTWEFDRLSQIEITEPGFSVKKIEIPPKRLSKGDFRITLIDDTDRAVTSIDALTEGEALWMADVLMREHPRMFRSND